jgi:hypothetical protein
MDPISLAQCSAHSLSISSHWFLTQFESLNYKYKWQQEPTEARQSRENQHLVTDEFVEFRKNLLKQGTLGYYLTNLKENFVFEVKIQGMTKWFQWMADQIGDSNINSKHRPTSPTYIPIPTHVQYAHTTHIPLVGMKDIDLEYLL